MINTVVIYESNGFIVSVIPYGDAENADPDLNFLIYEGEVSPNTHCVINGEVCLLKRMTFEDEIKSREGVYQLTLKGIPKNATVRWPDDYETVETDGVVVCDVNLPGDYSFVIQHPHFYWKEVTFNVES